MMSLRRRILLSLSILLFLLLGLGGLLVKRTVQESISVAEQERMSHLLYSLLASADFSSSTATDDSLRPIIADNALPDPRFLQTGQDALFARILDATGRLLWQSPSLAERARSKNGPVAFPEPPAFSRPGEIQVRWFEDDEDGFFVSLSMNVVWSADAPKNAAAAPRYLFEVIEDMSPFYKRFSGVWNFAWGIGAVLVVLLLATLAFMLGWWFRPFRRVSQDLDAVKGGQSNHLQGNYPQEFVPLTRSINTFIQAERAQRDRYRNTLADLAHSLKTPLAALRTGLEIPPVADREALLAQVQRMQGIVDYQLQRAAMAGRITLGAQTPLAPAVQRIVDTLRKVHRDRNLACEIQVPEGLTFPGEEGDLMELLGNVLENAFKWAHTRVRLQAREERDAAQARLQITVEDDGPGIAAERRREVLERGKRADESVPGHGIGLAIVQDILSVYGGDMTIADSELGGACIRFTLPVL